MKQKQNTSDRQYGDVLFSELATGRIGYTLTNNGRGEETFSSHSVSFLVKRTMRSVPVCRLSTTQSARSLAAWLPLSRRTMWQLEFPARSTSPTVHNTSFTSYYTHSGYRRVNSVRDVM